jgi:hypothetical protein
MHFLLFRRTNMTYMKTMQMFVAAIAVAAMAGSAGALNIINAGFEDPAFADGDWGPPGSGWSLGYYDQNGTADPTVWHDGTGEGNAGIWNPDADSGFPGGVAPEGQNTGWAESLSQPDADPILVWDVGLAQVLTDTLEADTQYVLGAQVGNAFYNESDVTADYRLELLAGGVLLGTDAGDSPAAGEWAQHSLTFTSGSSPAQLGEPLEIRLIAEAYADGGGVDGYEVDFDEIQLTAESISLLGDVNMDSVVNGLDVDPFVDVLLNGSFQTEADMNQDGEVNGLDVDPFVAAVVGGGTQQIPEPSTLLLVLVALGVVVGWRKWGG